MDVRLVCENLPAMQRHTHNSIGVTANVGDTPKIFWVCLSLLASLLLIVGLSSCGSVSHQPGPTALPATPTPYPPVIVAHASQTELKVNDIVTFTADVNAGAVGSLGAPMYSVLFEDEGDSSPMRPPSQQIKTTQMYFNVEESSILKLVSIYADNSNTIRKDSSFKAAFQAIRPGSTKVTLDINAEMCTRIDASRGGEVYNTPGCFWNFRTWQSAVTIHVTE